MWHHIPGSVVHEVLKEYVDFMLKWSLFLCQQEPFRMKPMCSFRMDRGPIPHLTQFYHPRRHKSSYACFIIYWEPKGCVTLKLSDSVCCLSLASSCSTRKHTVAPYTVRFLPVWNPVVEGMITICTLPTGLTNFIHSIFKPGPNVIIKPSQNYRQGPKQLL